MDLSFFIHITVKMSPTQTLVLFFFFLNTCEVKKKIFFISCTESLLLHRLSFSCGNQRLSCRCGAWTPVAAASLVAEHRLQGMWAQKLWREGSIVQSPGSQAQAQ